MKTPPSFTKNHHSMKKLMPVCIAICALFGCHHEPIETALPSCIQDYVKTVQQQPKSDPAAQVNEYIYQGKTVYYLPIWSPDAFNLVYDDGCQYICAPDGGFTGSGDGKCADFWKTAQFVRVAWKDAR
jgi:hypothetical protein